MDGLIVNAVVGRLIAVRKPKDMTLTMLHYCFGLSKRKIAKLYKVSDPEAVASC